MTGYCDKCGNTLCVCSEIVTARMVTLRWARVVLIVAMTLTLFAGVLIGYAIGTGRF